MNPTENQQTAQPTPPQYDYVGQEVQIGTGFGGMKPLAQHGTLAIASGVLSLYGSQNQLIASAPLSKCEAKTIWYTFNASAFLYIDGVRYSVSIGHGASMIGPIAPAPGFTLGQSVTGTTGFMKAFKQLKQAAIPTN